MNIETLRVKQVDEKRDVLFLCKEAGELPTRFFNSDQLSYIKTRFKHNKTQVFINNYKQFVFVQRLVSEKKKFQDLEKFRKEGANMLSKTGDMKVEELSVVASDTISEDDYFAYFEGLMLSSYRFDKYITSTEDDKKSSLKKLFFKKGDITEALLNELDTVVEAVFHARDLVNEPLNHLNAVQFAGRIKELGKIARLDVEVFEKKKIEALRMGGLLSVNKGSIDPPTFSIIKWKPENAVNDRPVVLVGKGIVYDTGGLSLKKTPDSMDYMKSDMAGAAAVVSTLYAVAKLKLPVYVVGLIPATDNRPDGNAYVPGDVITMHNGKTVEVKNTDAEGRLVLADGLSYGAKYSPELIFTVATLTGSAAMAIGEQGIVGMGNADAESMDKLKESGENVYERVVEFPFWEEYGEMLKSDIADLKNLGSGKAGAITAGKFLENFTEYPYIHLDIAGSSFIKSKSSYRGKQATGVGVRLLLDFLKLKSKV